MNVDEDLIGKTITGVIASVTSRQSPREIWLLQFSDGTHVEFVSPASRRALRRSTERRGRGAGTNTERGARRAHEPGQLSLSVA